MVDFRTTGRYQILAEIDALVDVFNGAGVRSYLEIGSKFGGSLWRVGKSLPKGSRVISVDLGRNGPSLPACIAQLKHDGYDARLIAGDSTDPAIIAQAAKLGPYDACFIDANHKKSYVESDWKHYGPMAKLVAFHDIGWGRVSETPNRIDVPVVWDVIKEQYRHKEFLFDPSGNHNGIGVLWRE